MPFTVVGVSKKKGAAFGQSLDEFVVIPLGAYQKLFGARQSLSLMVKPRDASLAALAQDEARVALRVDRGLKPAEPDNFGIVASDSVLGSSSRPRPASPWCWSASSGCRCWSAAS